MEAKNKRKPDSQPHWRDQNLRDPIAGPSTLRLQQIHLQLGFEAHRKLGKLGKSKLGFIKAGMLYFISNNILVIVAITS